jgi:hypothetical protein
MSLVSSLSKVVDAQPPGRMDGDVAVVSGNAVVPVKVSVRGLRTDGPVGVDIVFLIDNSGSMKYDWPCSDPDGLRFKCLRSLAEEFVGSRDGLDRLAIVLCAGDSPRVMRPESPWHRWHEIDGLVDQLLTIEPGGATPIDKGMQAAHDLLCSLSSAYRMAILLSDGLPTPDDESYPQTEIIMEHRVPEARAARILYSTIYLHTPDASASPQDNGLLAYIARLTDYVSQDPYAEEPRFYFRIERASAAADAYRVLFEYLKDRRVPQEVRLREVLSPRLRVDAATPVTFGGPTVDPLGNVINTPLAEAAAAFVDSGEFQLELNELFGPAQLQFGVRLDVNSITPAEFEQGYVELPVNRLPESSVSWIEPVPGQQGGVRCTAALPQATIRFEFGVKVIKTLSPDGSMVRVDVANLAPEPVDWFELVECPSGFANPSSVVDDFGFDPLSMLYEHRIVPWFLAQVPPSLLPPAGPAREQLRTRIRNAHAPLLQMKAALNPLLGQISSRDSPYGVDLRRYWRTRDARGYYRLAKRIEPKGSAVLQFGLSDASFLLAGTAPEALYARADAATLKPGDPQLSVYRAQGWDKEKEVLPNPERFQIAQTARRPDLHLATALRRANWKHFAALFRGLPMSDVTDPWSLVDSADIEPYWQNAGRQVGMKVHVRNGGADVEAGVRLHVQAIYLPFTGAEISAPNEILRPVSGSRAVTMPAIPHSADEDDGVWVDVRFRGLYFGSSEAVSVEQAPLEVLGRIKKAMLVAVVEIEAADGEQMTANNCAIEVAPIACT